MRPALARMMKMFRMRKMVAKIPVCRGMPTIRIAKMEQMRQGMPTTKARALGIAEENSRDSHAMMDERRTMADRRWRVDTTQPSTITGLGEFVLIVM